MNVVRGEGGEGRKGGSGVGYESGRRRSQKDEKEEGVNMKMAVGGGRKHK